MVFYVGLIQEAHHVSSREVVDLRSARLEQVEQEARKKIGTTCLRIRRKALLCRFFGVCHGAADS
jgi:hypothetical protein